MDDGFAHLFIGKTRMYQALREAGMQEASPQRNVPWVNQADNGDTIVNVWRHSLRQRRGAIYSEFASKKKIVRNPIARAKRSKLLQFLARASGATVRVVLLDERKFYSGLTSGCKCDTVRWSVHDLGDSYELRRGGKGKAEYVGVPVEPGAFGVLAPQKRQRVSQQIERLSRVRRATLERARYRCEIPACEDRHQFASLDVHHITRLGDHGSDHTDNTVALCPACHARVHRGITRVRERMDLVIDRIRIRHLNVRSKRRG